MLASVAQKDIRSPPGFERTARGSDYHRAERVWWVFLDLGFLLQPSLRWCFRIWFLSPRDLNTSVLAMISAIMLVFLASYIFGSDLSTASFRCVYPT